MNFQIQCITFTITFFTATLIYSTRTAYSYSKSQLLEETNLTQDDLGTIDMCFIFFNAISYLLMGDIAKNINIKIFLLCGVFLVGGSFIMIPICKLNDLIDPIYFIVLITLVGMSQSCVWIGLMTIINNWFGKSNNKLLLAIWTCNYVVGYIAGFFFGHVMLIIYQFSLNQFFTAVGLSIFFIGIIDLILLHETPNLNQNKNEQVIQNNNINQQQKKKKLNFFSTWVMVPNIITFVVIYSCMKSANQGLLFWLPYYLDESGLQYYSSMINQIMLIGSVIGQISIGAINNQFGKSYIILGPILLTTTVLLWIFKNELVVNIFYILLILIIGVFLLGTNNILTTSISINLANQPELQNYNNPIISISSIMYGSTGVISAIFLKLIPIIGVEHLFYIIIFLTLLTGILLIPIMIKEMKELKRNKLL